MIAGVREGHLKIFLMELSQHQHLLKEVMYFLDNQPEVTFNIQYQHFLQIAPFL